MGRIRSLWLFIGLVLFAVSFYDVSADVIPSENECRPYIEKAIHELKNPEPTATDNESTEEDTTNTGEDTSIEPETTTPEEEEAATEDANIESAEGEVAEADNESKASVEDDNQTEEAPEDGETSAEEQAEENQGAEDNDSQEAKEDDNNTAEDTAEDGDTKEVEEPAAEDGDSKEEEESATAEDNDDSKEADQADDGVEEATTAEDADGDSKEGDEAEEQANEQESAQEDDVKSEQENEEESTENEQPQANESLEEAENTAAESDDGESAEAAEGEQKDEAESAEEAPATAEDNTAEEEGDGDDNEADSQENATNEEAEATEEDDNATAEAAESVEEKEAEEEKVRAKRSVSDEAAPEEDETANDSAEGGEQSQENADDADTKEEESQEEEPVAEATAEDNEESQEATEEADNDTAEDGDDDNDDDANDDDEENDTKSEESMPEEELTLEFEIPKNLRPREHITDLLGLDAKSSIKENALKRTGDVILKELKKIYDNAIKPLEQMYKYRDLSNRHFGDPEIFSKPLVLFMGPWSGGKSTILNYLTDNEYTPNSIRSGAEPSPAYFNILMHGDEPEVLDGTQLAADWTFAGLQKFGQGLNDRLRGQKLPSKLLERVNIVEIPGILEVRKQVSRYFPFNDACQWFIDRADIIFLVYDPSKLDVGPETEAILDQLKGREYQTRILLNKADQVKPEELLRVQSALIWNISPLMSSAQPPVMYTVSLWSHPFEQGAPTRLLQAQERALLTDLREAIDKRIENKIASARRFAVRIRNHAKMVDCYLTTYYNQKSLFSNKKQISDKIIEHPQNYNIYEGLSTLTNISRYDLPDPEVYLDFFRLNPLYEFKKLSETCTYFKGCPINKLDIAIAYDLPELVGKYKKLMEENYSQLIKEFDDNCNQSETEPPVKLR